MYCDDCLQFWSSLVNSYKVKLVQTYARSIMNNAKNKAISDLAFSYTYIYGFNIVARVKKENCNVALGRSVRKVLFFYLFQKYQNLCVFSNIFSINTGTQSEQNWLLSQP